MNQLSPNAKEQLRRILVLSAILVLICVSAWWTSPIENLNRRVADTWFQLHEDKSTSDVVLILIDDRSLEKVGRWPWSRTVLAQLVDKLAAQQPKVIGIDILLSEPESKAADVALADAIYRAGNVVLVDKISGPTGDRLWVDPIPELQNAAVSIGHAQALLDPDGVCRRFPLAELTLHGPRLAFGLQVATLANAQAASAFREHQERVAGRSLIDTDGDLERVMPILAPIAYRRSARSPAFNAFSAADILGGIPDDSLRGKVVLVGFGSSDIHDRLVTPVSGSLPTPGVEIHAHIADAILSGRALSPMHVAVQLVWLVALCAVSVAAGVRLSSTRAAVASIGVSAMAYVLGYLSFVTLAKLADAGSMMIAPILAIPLVQVEKLIRIEASVNRQLRSIRAGLRIGGLKQTGDVNWKLETLEQLQNQLKSLYEFEHALLESTQDLIAVFAPSGALLFCNSQFREMWKGMHPDLDIRLEEFESLVRGAGGKFEIDAPAVPTECLLNDNLWSVRRTRVDLEEAADAIMVVMSDLQARMERDRSRAEALAFATHELRTPLVAIQGLAELMTRFPEKTTSREAPDVIFRESRRLVALINSYLDVLRLDSGARPLKLLPTDANTIVKHVVNVLRPLADSSRVRLLPRKNPLSPQLICDAALMTGALMNLVSNAIKYGGEGSEVRVSIAVREPDLIFSVWNSGPAIPPEEIGRLFDPYYRGSAERSERSGWGLGLAFVRRMVDQHQGKVTVQSTDDQGTEFQIIMPGAVHPAAREVGAS